CHHFASQPELLYTGWQAIRASVQFSCRHRCVLGVKLDATHTSILSGFSLPMFWRPLLLSWLRRLFRQLAWRDSYFGGAQIVIFRTALSLKIFVEPADDVFQTLHPVPRLA